MPFARGNVLRHLGFDPHPECCEVEANTRAQLRTGTVLKADLRRILVVGTPVLRIVQERPYLSRRQLATMTSFETKLSVVPGRYLSGQLMSFMPFSFTRNIVIAAYTYQNIVYKY
jgi:S-adenosylmethionine:tRNA-ribosyltransferase-isomerase (queuine synthetase)